MTQVRPLESRSTSTKVLMYLLLAIFSLVFLLPLFWMLSTALKPLGSVSSFPPNFIPHPMMLSNFVKSVTVVPFMHDMLNTTWYTGLALIGDLLSASFISYAFSRIRSRYSNLMFIFVLATMMIPYQATMIPQFILFRWLHWVNTYLPLIVPTYFGNAFLIFLMRQFCMSIPAEMDEAAKIDGASHFRIWWQIIVPLSRPALASVAIFSFMFHWNDYLGPLIYLNSDQLYPVALGLAQYTAAYGGTAWNLLMSASIIAILPCIIVFALAQKYLVQGISVGGLK